MDPLELWIQIDRVIDEQRLNYEKMRVGGHGSVGAKDSLRHAATDLRLLCERFRAITVKGLTEDDLKRLNQEHDLRWARRRRPGVFKNRDMDG
jgi:hypothetical protein